MVAILLIAACSSSGSSPSDSASDEQLDPGEDQSVVTNGDEDLPVPVDVIPQTELNPVELLLHEIRQAATNPLLDLNRKLQSGIELTAAENNCLDGFDVATGQALTSIHCDSAAVADQGTDENIDENSNTSGLTIYNSDFQLLQSHLVDATNDMSEAAQTTNCEQSLFNGNTEACQLRAADMLLPVIWVPDDNNGQGQGPIASIDPLQGAAISYNSDADGLLVLQSVSELFVSFYCEIDIANASLTDSSLAAGNCRQQVQRLINRLFELRTTAVTDVRLEFEAYGGL